MPATEQMTTPDALLLTLIATPALAILIQPLTIALARRRWERLARKNALREPSVSLAVPLARTEQHAAENIRSYFRQRGFGKYQVVLVAEDPGDPAAGAAREAAASNPEVEATLAFSGAAEGRIGKMHNLRKALRYCHNDIIAFTDSDVAFPDDRSLRTLVGPLENPQVGLITACPLYRRPTTIGGYLLATMINADLWGCFSLLAAFNRMNVANGAFLALRKAVLDQVSGLDDMQYQVLNDTALAQRILAAGRRILLSGMPVSITTPALTTAEWWRQIARWHVGMRRVLPLAEYILFGIYRSPMALGLLLSLVDSSPYRLLFIALPLFARIASFAAILVCWVREARAIPEIFLVFLTDLVSPLFWVLSWLQKRVHWRERIYSVGRGGIAKEIVDAE